MPTTILDGETYPEALQRRYYEESKLEKQMKLWHMKDDKELKVGDIVKTHDGNRWFLFGMAEPKENDPEGEVQLHALTEMGTFKRFFPRAIGAEWRNL